MNRSRRLSLWIIGAAFFMVGLIVSPDGLRVGDRVPDFTLPSITGKSVALREYMSRGLVIVHFWKSK